jgi:hypothetical protein
LLSGEALYLDVKRMEMAYHDNNKRELELTRHVSLRQLDPIALVALRATGTCQVTIPEWLYDMDCAGHYMRRIKSVALSLPSVVGPYTSVNRTLSLLKSSLRKSPIAGDNYVRQGSEDGRLWIISAQFNPLSPAERLAIAACLRPTYVMSGFFRSRAPGPKVLGSLSFRRIILPSTTQRSQTRSCRSVTRHARVSIPRS